MATNGPKFATKSRIKIILEYKIAFLVIFDVSPFLTVKTLSIG